MALPNVEILLQNGQLGGVAAFAEGVCAIIGTGTAVAGKIQIGDPRVVFSLEDAKTIGITLADNANMYRQVKEFYDEAGRSSELYIMIVPNTMTLTQMSDITNANGIVKLLDFAQGRVRVWGSYFVPAGGYVPVLTNGVDADALSALQKAHATATAYALAHIPNRAIIEGRAFNGNAANLTDLHTMTYNRAAMLIGGTASNGSASIGLALGRLSKLPVQRKISRVKNGAVNATEVFIGATEAGKYAQTNLIHDKGYITFRIFEGKSGYFFNRDWTAAPLSDDYSTLSRGRVIDKASVIAYLTYLEELDDEVLVNEDGTMNIGNVKYLENSIESAIGTSMGSGGEISFVEAFINPAQNITSTEELTVALEIGSVAYNGKIKVLLGFAAPNNS